MRLVKETAIYNSVAVIVLCVAILILAACGESSPTAAPTTQAGATTGVAGGSSNPTGAAVGPIGTPNKTTVAPNMGLNVPTIQPITNGTAALPSIPGTSVVQLDPELLASTARLVPGVSNPTVQMFASDNTPDKLAADTDTSFLGAGYKFVFPGISKPSKLGITILGLYAKTGAPDILLSVTDVPTDVTLVSRSIGLPILSQASSQKYLDQVKGKKSVAILVAAIGVLQAFSSNIGITPQVPADLNATTAPATVSGSPATSAAPVIGEQDIPLYPGSKKTSSGAGAVGDTTDLYYVSSDDYAKITAWAKQAYTDKGWDGVATNEQNNLTTVTGRKGKYSLIVSILSPKARVNTNFDNFFKQANAGPDDTVMVVVITS